MCGITGHFSLKANGMTDGDVKIAREMAIASTVRGYDGTGILMLDSKTQQLLYNKEPVTAGELMSKDDWVSTLAGSRFVIGHNRSATIGNIDEASTHPFLFSNVCGVHNGTISSWREIWKDATASMDSEALFEALNNVPEDIDSVSKFLEDIPWTGAYSIVWYDTRAKELRFARNSERPMNIITSGDGIWFGSELPMLEWILLRNRTYLHESVELGVGTLLCIPVDGSTATHHPFVVDDYSYAPMSWSYHDSKDNNAWYNYQQERAGSIQQFADARTYNNGGYSATIGKFFDVTQFGHLPTSSNIKDVLPDIKLGLSLYTGVDVTKRTPAYWDIESVLAGEIHHRYSEAGRELDKVRTDIDVSKGTISMSVTLVDIDSACDTFLGYVDLGNELAPVSIKCWSADMLRSIKEELSKSTSVITYPLPLRGVRVYHTGQLVPIIGTMSLSKEGTLYKGPSLKTKKGKKLIKQFGLPGNPFNSAFATKGLKWKEAWGGSNS